MGARIDAGARLGWLLRVSREALGVNLAEMSARLSGGTMSLSVASISSIERSGQRDGRIVDAYEVRARTGGRPAAGPDRHPLPDLRLRAGRPRPLPGRLAST